MRLPSCRVVDFRRIGVGGACANSRSSSSAGPQGVEDGPRVVELLAIDDDPEVERVQVAHHGDVDADPVEHSGDRDLRSLPCAAEVLRRRRTGHVRDRDVGGLL